MAGIGNGSVHVDNVNSVLASVESIRDKCRKLSPLIERLKVCNDTIRSNWITSDSVSKDWTDSLERCLSGIDILRITSDKLASDVKEYIDRVRG